MLCKPFFFVCPYAEGVVFSCKVLALNVFPNGAALDLSAPEQDVGARHGVPVCCRILQSCPNLHFRMHLWSRAEHRHLYCGEECARFVSHKSDTCWNTNRPSLLGCGPLVGRTRSAPVSAAAAIPTLELCSSYPADKDACGIFENDDDGVPFLFGVM